MVKRKKQTTKEENNFFRDNYTDSWLYIKESKNFFYIIIGIFALFIFVGAFLPVPSAIEQQILDLIEELLRNTESLSWGGLMSFIFFNNLQSSFLGMLFGIVLGIFSVVTVVVNGYLLGFVASRVTQSEGIFVLWRLLPHGIFELPALFISLGLGLKLGTFIFKKNKIKSLKKYFWNSLKVFLFVVLPLLIVAAFIEGSLIFLFRS